jgi:hypothetical protein
MNLFAPIPESWQIDGVANRRAIKARPIKLELSVKELKRRHRNVSKLWQQNVNRELVRKLQDRKKGPELTKHNKNKKLKGSAKRKIFVYKKPKDSVKRKNVNNKRLINCNRSRKKRKGPISNIYRLKKLSANVYWLRSKRQRELASSRKKKSKDVYLKKRPDKKRYDKYYARCGMIIIGPNFLTNPSVLLCLGARTTGSRTCSSTL